MNSRWPPLRGWSFCILLVALGLAVCGYLLQRVFVLLDARTSTSADLCSVLFASSCDGALRDPQSWILGIPLAGWGLVHFTTLGGLLLLARFVEGAFEDRALLAATALSIVGTVVGFSLTAAAVLSRSPICPLCIVVHALNLALVLALQRLIARPIREQLSTVQRTASRLLPGAPPAGESARWQVVGCASVVLVGALAYQWIYVEAALRRPPPVRALSPAEVVAAYRSSPEHSLPVTQADPHFGPLDAPVQLVVFESFRCPHCQQFAATIHRLQSEFGDRLLVAFRHYPLSSRCNDRLRADLQPDACEVAWAAEAAHRQARFWAFHDAMLAPGVRATSERIAQAVRDLRMDPARFEADRHSPTVHERVAHDIELGNRLEVPGTPAAFLDGRLVRQNSAAHLEILIREELKRKAAKGTEADHANKDVDRSERRDRTAPDG
jgi:protein-disulfide isomerase/uncharacterized membrane protein